MVNNLRRGKYVEPFSPTLGDDVQPALKCYRYLGVETGRVTSQR